MIRDEEKHKMYFPSLCLENFYFDGLGYLWTAAFDQPSQSLSELLLCVPSLAFVSYRGIASKSQSIIMGARLVDIAKISMITVGN